MVKIYMKHLFFMVAVLLLNTSLLYSQNNLKLKYKNSEVYAGIDIGSKGVKLSLVEIGKDLSKNSTFNILKDSSVNTDFISFTQPSFHATLNSLAGLYFTAKNDYKLIPERIFTVVSSGIKVQAEKSNNQKWITNLIDSFKLKINEPARTVEIIDVYNEAKLSHLGIVPDSRRYNTFLIDIGSGNTKGGYFPNGNTTDFRLFQLSWGTKSTANATDKRLLEDRSIYNFNKQLYRVLAGTANDEIVYAVNLSGAYNMSDNIAFSGGIAWAVASLISPELIENPVIPVTYDEVEKFYARIFNNYISLSDTMITKQITDPLLNKVSIGKEIKRVNTVFDQPSLMAGSALLLKIMRQFEGIYEKKQFYLVKNGQVGWISAYVNQSISRTNQTVSN